MRVRGVLERTIRPTPDGRAVEVIDQTRLPEAFEFVRLENLPEAAAAIRSMIVRGAPLIGVTAAYGVWLGLIRDPSDAGLARAGATLVATRPTAVNLAWAVERVRAAVAGLPPERRAAAARATADAMAEEDVETNRAIGIHGAAWILGRRPGPFTAARPLAILTHCNAGWLATVDGGTALAPVYRLHDEGVPVHVWVDETRPRNQGARLTAWELSEHGVPCTLVADNAGGHLCQRGLVDLCIVGADRVTSTGDVANKIGTYLKALAAAAHDVPFLVAVPSSTIDPELLDGVASIPIERRSPREVTHVEGALEDGGQATVRISPAGVPAENPAFDVTPARLVGGLVTERGVVAATGEAIRAAFPERFGVDVGDARP